MISFTYDWLSLKALRSPTRQPQRVQTIYWNFLFHTNSARRTCVGDARKPLPSLDWRVRRFLLFLRMSCNANLLNCWWCQKGHDLKKTSSPWLIFGVYLWRCWVLKWGPKCNNKTPCCTLGIKDTIIFPQVLLYREIRRNFPNGSRLYDGCWLEE